VRIQLNPLKNNILTLFSLSIISYICIFLYSHKFGLYEDDYWFICSGYNQHLRELIYRIGGYFIHWPQGRPINQSLPVVFAFVGNHIGGLSSMYFISSLWLGINAWLVFLLARTWLSTNESFIAGVIFILFPADTGRAFLTYSGVEISMTFLLLAWLCWTLTGKIRWISYFIAFLCLLSFETLFLPFLAAPLYGRKSKDISEKRMWFEHIIGCSTIILFTTWLRLSLGESRVANVLGSPTESIRKSLSSTIIGPCTVLKTYLHAFELGFINLTIPSIVVAISIIALICFNKLQYKSLSLRPDRILNYRRYILAGLISWCGSYLFTLVDYPPTQIAGRLTTTHTAGAIPFALTVAYIFQYLKNTPKTIFRLTNLIAIIILTLLCSYAFHIQDDYISSFSLQKRFWKQIISKAPDVNETSSIIVAGNPEAEKYPRAIQSNSWSDYYACRVIYNNNTNLDQENGIKFGHLGVNPELWSFKLSGDKIIAWKPRFWENKFELLDSSNLILFYSDNGILKRVKSLKFQIYDAQRNLKSIEIDSTRTIPVPNENAHGSNFIETIWKRVD